MVIILIRISFAAPHVSKNIPTYKVLQHFQKHYAVVPSAQLFTDVIRKQFFGPMSFPLSYQEVEGGWGTNAGFSVFYFIRLQI